MEIIAFPPCGICGEISYLISSEKEAAVIDPSSDTEAVLSVLEERGLTLTKILLTHGHFDHIGGLAELAEKTGAEVLIHKEDIPLLTDDRLNLSEPFGEPPADKYSGDITALSDGDKFTLCGKSCTVINTPGHTKGSSLYITEDGVFTGDTIFSGSIGRTDMPGGDPAAMSASLKRIAVMFGELSDRPMYSGHTSPSRIKTELKYNPYLKGTSVI